MCKFKTLPVLWCHCWWNWRTTVTSMICYASPAHSFSVAQTSGGCRRPIRSGIRHIIIPRALMALIWLNRPRRYHSTKSGICFPHFGTTIEFKGNQRFDLPFLRSKHFCLCPYIWTTPPHLNPLDGAVQLFCAYNPLSRPPSSSQPEHCTAVRKRLWSFGFGFINLQLLVPSLATTVTIPISTLVKRKRNLKFNPKNDASLPQPITTVVAVLEWLSQDTAIKRPSVVHCFE